MPNGIDHLIYATPDLELGIGEIEELLAVRPIAGGRHPDFGTQNALVSLGPMTYLEIIAPDPGAAAPDRGVLFGLDELERSRLVTWVLRTDEIEEDAETARSLDLGLGDIQEGGREKPDGTRLSWRVTDPYAMPLEGAVPFLIDWGATPHPAGNVPRAGALAGFRIEHPRADPVRDTLAALGMLIDVRRANAVRLVASIRTGGGDVVLE